MKLRFQPRPVLFAAAFALLATAAHHAAAQDLTVDSSNNNSPYPVTSDQSFVNVTVGNPGTGVLNQSAGTFSVTNVLIVGGTGSTSANGTYNLSGGAVTASTSVEVGVGATAALNQTGGTITSNVGRVGSSFPGGVGTYNLSAGTASFNSFAVGASGATGTMNQSGTGSLTINGIVTLGRNNGLGGTGAGTYNLDGGTLTAQSIRTNVVAGVTGTLNLNGGTLVASVASATFINAVTRTNVRDGGATINSNGFAITVPQVLAHSNVAGDNATDGGLRKLGAGTLTLSAANTYTGPTRVNAGTLALASTGTLANTASVTINAGGMLTLGAANQLNAAAPLTLNAASGPGAGAAVAFNTGGFSQTLGALTLSSTSVVDLASGASLLRLGNSVPNTWTGTLAIWNYTGTAVTGNGTDEVFFGANTAGLTPAQLASIRFYSDSGTTALAAPGYASLTGGEVVPGGLFPATGGAVPEPSTWALLGLGVLGAGVVTLRRRTA